MRTLCCCIFCFFLCFCFCLPALRRPGLQPVSPYGQLPTRSRKAHSGFVSRQFPFPGIQHDTEKRPRRFSRHSASVAAHLVRTYQMAVFAAQSDRIAAISPKKELPLYPNQPSKARCGQKKSGKIKRCLGGCPFRYVKTKKPEYPPSFSESPKAMP